MNRIKRDVDLDHILFKKLNEEIIKSISTRQKRDTLAHVEDVMENVRGQIKGLQVIVNILVPINILKSISCNT